MEVISDNNDVRKEEKIFSEMWDGIDDATTCQKNMACLKNEGTIIESLQVVLIDDLEFLVQPRKIVTAKKKSFMCFYVEKL